ncbi:MAG: LysM peptidoglycan-binding domain-containing protein [Desulfobacteraceae bacterium]|nr:MAG: LysM peptidoglycan-binding domain-containing protein [Desulfobacteraceae bacterium]
MKKSHLLIFLMVASLVGCAPLIKRPPKEIGEVSPEALKKILVTEYLQDGKKYEEMGDLVTALGHYKRALTVDPLNQEAIESRKGVEEELHSSAEEHYQAGIKFYKAGKYGRARHEFLIALRLWPEHAGAVKMLTTRKRIQIKRYVIHTVQPGENLAKVAKMYYGNHRKFPLIAKYNNITDATRLYVGQKIKVPEIEGVPLLARKEGIRTEELAAVGVGLREWEKYTLEEQEPAETPAVVEKEEALDQVASYRDDGVELFSIKKYQEAIDTFNKVLNVYPQDSIALEYSHKAYLQHGMSLFGKEDYLAARDQFKACLRFKNDSQKCQVYLEKSENLYKEVHYRKGIQLFDKELLTEAIDEWKLVRLIDPNYKRVDYLITKAKTILKNIQELKDSQKE